ncbi:copper transporter [Actinopolymorpha singaporensis]|uniref:Copper transport outer membrane protein, MctB n=1 Tax=Actinopolymorpha singaporensis TaxID=117157 RepID=A0A1H1W355_9ACTN|nr:copper transporter [Actinopolymorpha singaporensis]SDS91150.1 Copper transport outer membrane protein, MctB [Actinopolymorpha singaporensis]
MIDFRYFLVSIAAIFLALAVGVALGAGPLKGELDQQLRGTISAVSKEKDGLRKQIADLQQGDKYRDSFAADIAPSLVKGRLSGQKVVVVALPNADSGVVKDVEQSLTSAGATVTGTVSMTDKWSDPSQRQFLEELATRLVTGDVRMPDNGSAYDRAGVVLARALVTRDAKAAGRKDNATPTIMGAFGEGDLVNGDSDLPQADLAVVVAPPVPAKPKPTPDSDANQAWVSLARSLDSASRGAVMVGDPSAAGDGGVLASLRADKQARDAVSSVDVADLASGQVATVWALAEQATGGVGQYGAVGATDGALPKQPTAGS